MEEKYIDIEHEINKRIYKIYETKTATPTEWVIFVVIPIVIFTIIVLLG